MDSATATHASVTLAGRKFAISTVTTPTTTSTYLTGPGGGLYYLRPFLGADDGLREIIATSTGAALRIGGNVVRAYLYGDIIEQA
jgi:hypothetical protein